MIISIKRSFKFIYGEGTETNPYLINSPSDMAFFAKDVKEGNDYLNKFKFI